VADLCGDTDVAVDPAAVVDLILRSILFSCVAACSSGRLGASEAASAVVRILRLGLPAITSDAIGSGS